MLYIYRYISIQDCETTRDKHKHHEIRESERERVFDNIGPFSERERERERERVCVCDKQTDR